MGTADTGRCPRCETENDPLFTYCRSCVQMLSET
ncbi:DUF7577 domain-containing protein [Halocatena marina]